MKTRILGLVVLIMMSSCMGHYCPTYNGSKGHSDAMVSAKKAKPAKVKHPHFKSVRLAEKD